jgi:hypothetical protein
MTPIAHTGLPQGTLDLLILETLALKPRHGWAISERLAQISGATQTIRQGSLYPLFIAWSVADGSKRHGVRRKTTDVWPGAG